MSKVIGKKLSERYVLGALAHDRAMAVLDEMLATHAKALVEVRAKDARMIACLVVRADKATIRLCRGMGLDIRPGGTAVFGVLGADAARLFAQLPAHQRAWLGDPCGPRETKVVLVAGGIALLSLQTNEGKVSVAALT